MTDLRALEAACEAFLQNHLAPADLAHDLSHIRRVVANARALALGEGADLAIVLPAAWLHDCVAVAKDSPLRPRASTLAAERASAFLASIGYPAAQIAAIAHAIQAHSFSAQIAPQSLEAKVVQDADRLDSLGAIGLARCLITGASLNRALYHPAEPFPLNRPPDDGTSSVDHFFTKLLHLSATMQTAAGRREAERRTLFLRQFLAQLASELDLPDPCTD